MENPIIIIGTGLAGYQLAKEFRKHNQQTPLLIITGDEGLFYSKPLLSTGLTNKKSAEQLATANAETMANQLNATILTQTWVTQIHPHAKKVDCGQISYDYQQLVLACGASPMVPPLKGTATHKILSINNIYHYSDFRNLLIEKSTVTLLGSGLIGSEFANDLSNAGYLVNVVSPARYPLDQFLPETLGLSLKQALIEKGVNFYLNCLPEELNEDEGKFLLTLTNQQVITSDLVLSAIGLKPNITLAQQAMIQTRHGILVDRFLETNVPGIFALGDCAEVEGHVLPYITPLLNATKALAKTLNGDKTAVDYPAMPIVVKTQALPIAFCPPPKNAEGQWSIESKPEGLCAFFFNKQQQLLGFVVSGKAISQRNALAQTLPRYF